jgi:hypothetical protein
MKFFLVWAFISASGSLDFIQVGAFDTMRGCLEIKRDMKDRKGKWAKGSFSCVWVRE